MATIPKLALIPSGYKDGKLYSVLPTDGVGDFDVTRGSNATRINKNGLIETVTGNTPRLDYTDGGCPSLLLEPASTNLIPYSQDFSNASWTTSGSIIKEGNTSDILALDKTQSVGKLTFNGTGSLSEAFIAIPSGSSSTYTLSFYLKGTVGETLSSYMDTVAGTYVFNSSDILLTGEWQRVSYSINTLANNVGVNIIVRKESSETVNTVYIWGAMLEQSSYPTSYIPTSGSQITRLAETANGSGNASTFNDSEGVLMAEISALADDGTFRLITLSDGTTSNRLSLGYRSTSNAIYCEIRNANVTQAFLITTINDIKTKSKVSVKYKADDFALWVNGFEVSTDTSGLTPINLSKINFDSGQQNGAYFYGNTKQIQYFDTALTDLEIETLTSYTSFNKMALTQNYIIQ